MTLPDSVATATLSHTFIDAAGAARSGTVTARPTVRTQVGDTGITIDPVTAYLDESGRFSMVLAATDDTDIQPVGWAYTFVINVGQERRSFNAFLPAGVHDLGDLTSVSPVDPNLPDVKSVNGIFPDEEGDVDLGPISAPVTSVAGKIGAVTLVKGDVGLGSVDNTSDSGKPISTATQTALDSKSATSHNHTGTYAPLAHTHPISDVVSLQAGLDAKASKPTVRQAYITTGDVNPLPNTSGVWQPITGFEITVPAVVGDYIDVSVVAMRHVGGGAANVMLDAAVRVGSSNVRYLATGTSTPPAEGDPGWYSATNIVGRSGPRGFTVISGDLDGGNVRLVMATKANGTGILYASTSYPFYWRAINYGPVN